MRYRGGWRLREFGGGEKRGWWVTREVLAFPYFKCLSFIQVIILRTSMKEGRGNRGENYQASRQRATASCKASGVSSAMKGAAVISTKQPRFPRSPLRQASLSGHGWCACWSLQVWLCLLDQDSQRWQQVFVARTGSCLCLRWELQVSQASETDPQFRGWPLRLEGKGGPGA